MDYNKVFLGEFLKTSVITLWTSFGNCYCIQNPRAHSSLPLSITLSSLLLINAYSADVNFSVSCAMFDITYLLPGLMHGKVQNIFVEWKFIFKTRCMSSLHNETSLFVGFHFRNNLQFTSNRCDSAFPQHQGLVMILCVFIFSTLVSPSRREISKLIWGNQPFQIIFTKASQQLFLWFVKSYSC